MLGLYSHHEARDSRSCLLLCVPLDSLDDEDEVLLVMAEELGNFVDVVGGPQHAYLLLKPLESLATVDEASVRDMVRPSSRLRSIVQSVRTLTDSLLCATGSQVDLCDRRPHAARARRGALCLGPAPPRHARLVRPHSVSTRATPSDDLHSADHHSRSFLSRLYYMQRFTSRIASCHLFQVGYPRVSSELQKELRQMFAQLCRDDTPMVRKAASAALGGFASVVRPAQLCLLVAAGPPVRLTTTNSVGSDRPTN